MRPAAEFDSSFLAAERLQQQGRLADAERSYRQLAATDEHRERALRALVDLYVQASRVQQAAETLVTLTELRPEAREYYWHLADLLQRSGKPEAAIAHYRRLLARQPDYAAGYYNLALLHRRALQFREALRAYDKAIALGIDNAQEVYANIGVVYAEMRDAVKARAMYRRALAIDADCLPALYNLAGLLEETGDGRGATELYERILAARPRHWDAVARLAQVHKATHPDDPLIDRLRQAVDRSADEPLAQEGLYFALGKLLDGARRYEEAAAAYRAGNALGQRRNRPYDRSLTAQGFDRLMRHFDAEWIAGNSTASTASPIFVCGMFRSGSTLVERMLGAHPAITAGGELDFLPWLIARDLAPYPQRVRDVSARDLARLGDDYLARTGELFPDAANLTDKRPDNFLHLGLLKAMFPRVRIVYTRRNRLDNCLSLYFQQLGGNLGYATNLSNAAHYYAQHERLMDHWQSCFGNNVFTVDYDELVRRPEPVLRRLLRFLGVAWDARCLSFERSAGLVKTASLWQVREGLHRASSGRWRHYEKILPELEAVRRAERPGRR